VFALSAHPRKLTAGALLLATLVAACGQATASSTSTPTTARPAASFTPKHGAKLSSIDHMTTVGRAVYARETSGAHTMSVLHAVGSDPTLVRFLQSKQLGAARAYVARKYPHTWYHWHVSRMRITQGSQVVTEVGVPFVVPAAQMTLRGSGGRSVGTLEVSMQDEIGFVRLMHRHYPAVDVVIRGRGPSHVRTSMRAATLVKLPATGNVSIGGRRYAVRSFHERAWDGEQVMISLLMKA
jgi:hypothetical protein